MTPLFENISRAIFSVVTRQKRLFAVVVGLDEYQSRARHSFKPLAFLFNLQNNSRFIFSQPQDTFLKLWTYSALMAADQ
jgi:hypothetical protein